VGDRLELGGFLQVGKVLVGEMWATGSSWEGFLGRHVPIGTVNMEHCDQCTARLRSCALQLFNTPTSEQNNTLTRTPNQRRGNNTLQASTIWALALVGNKC
jgi:hypothetical protein